MVYEPQEDSDLLAKYVRERASGSVLDMGTGSGVQVSVALENKKVTAVVAVDVDSEATKVVQERFNDDPRVTVLESNLFTNVQQKFDTIVCNPPYLPNEKKDDNVALYGGPQGYEYVQQFLKEAKEYLKPGGQILLLFSSLTNKERVDALVKEYKYISEELGLLAMFFERLYVYRLTV